MKRSGKIILTLIVLVAIAGISAFVITNRDTEDEEIPFITVERGDIVDKALAVGTIEPRVEISVKSQFSGVAKRQFADVGDFVKAGAALLEIQPTPTPKELVDCRATD